MVARIKKNDTVMVISGKDKGKSGTVIEILPKKGKVMVKGVGIRTRHAKARKQGDTPGIKKEEGFITINKLMPVCGACGKASRVNAKLLESGKRARMCNRCKEIF